VNGRTEAAGQALQRRTRRPTGKPSWPILLVAGREKAGKSWSCAEASGSDLVGRTLWVGVGEDDPDEYGNVPGADFEIVEHDGTYRDILAALQWATRQTSPDGRPVLVVLDSASRLWDLLCDMAQDDANRRAAKKGRASDEAEIHMDLWNVAAGRWTRITGNEVCGKTLAIVGFGRIGREVAIRARAFGLRVIGYGNYWDEDFARWHDITRVESFDDLLAQADFISLHTKLTAKTRHLIHAGNIGRIRPGAVIVNCARGEILELPALVAALKSGHLKAYAADVLDQEPTPADHPLLGLPNVILTPHIGSRTHESVQRQASCAVENLTRFLSGRTPIAQANVLT